MYDSSIFSDARRYASAYSSPYSGAFPLIDTMRIPKACAFKSTNMT